MTTETAKHTPGPWALDRAVREDEPFVRIRGAEYALAEVYIDTNHLEEAEANAALLAAAPEMLVALEMVKAFLPEISGLHIGSSFWGVINDAIAKARGAS